jgi:hypothetical protein
LRGEEMISTASAVHEITGLDAQLETLLQALED